MVSELDSSPDRVVWVRALPGQSHCIVFLGKTLSFHSASLRPGVQMDKFNAGGNPVID